MQATENGVAAGGGHEVRLGPLIVTLLSAVVLCVFADRDGYEGDDLSSIVPMLDIEAALDGLIPIYRYDWQPLSYRLGAWLYDLSGQPEFIFLIAPIAIAIALGLLYRAAAAIAAVPVPIFLCLVLMTPEIVFTGLYFNAAAPAFACACGAMALAVGGTGAVWRSAAVGGLLAMAALFRLDFLLVAPALLVLFWWRCGRLAPSVIAGLVACGLGLAAVGSGLIRIDQLLETYRAATAELATRADEGGWDDFRKIMVATTVFSPLGWTVYPAALVYLAATASWRERGSGALLGLSLLPTLLPVPDLLSVKYMMPLFVVLPLAAAVAWRRLRDRLGSPTARRLLDGGLVAATLALLVAAVEVDNQSPYLRVAVSDARQIGTHDGFRSWGAYAAQVAQVDRLRAPDETQRLGWQLAETLEAVPGLTVVFVGSDDMFGAGAVGWRHARLRLAREGYPGEVVGRSLVRIAVGRSRLWLAGDPAAVPPEIAGADESVILRVRRDGTIDGLEALPRAAGS